MKYSKILFAIIAAFCLLAGKSAAQQVKFDYDRGADFSQYKTFSWEKVQTRDALFIDRIKSDVGSALAAKGLTEVSSGGDLSVIAVQMTKDQQTLNTFYDGFGGGWGWRRFGGGGFGDFGQSTTTTDTYKVGTLILDLFDTKTKQLVWRGSTSDTLSSNSNKNIENLNKGVEKLFKQFPPEQKKK